MNAPENTLSLPRRAVWQGLLGGFVWASMSCASLLRGRASTHGARVLGAETARTVPLGKQLLSWLELPLSPHFPIGLSSGDPTSDSILLSTLYLGPNPLKVLLVQESESEKATAPIVLDTEIREGGYVQLEAKQLRPQTSYLWGFFEQRGDTLIARSEQGRFRTAPAASEAPTLRLAALSCTVQWFDHSVLEQVVLNEGPLDAILVAGDAVYADGSKTLEDYRARWRHSLESRGWRSLRASAPVVATWDDHEFENDVNPETIEPSQFQHAQQAFFEVNPVRQSAPQRLWRKVSFGQTADVFVLDARTERLPSTRLTSKATYLSSEQLQWLKSELKASQARFKFLLNSVPMADFPGIFDSKQNDRWEGYAAQREDLLTWMESESIRGVLWISGDFHLASLGTLGLKGPGAEQHEILVGPAAQVGNPLTFELKPPQFSWVSNEENVTLLECDPTQGKVTCRWRGKSHVLYETTLEL